MTSIAFNLPRTVTLAADVALLGAAATHAYVLATALAPPGYFAVYCVAVIIGCVAAAGIIWIDVNDVMPPLGWLAGDVICTAFVIGYPISRLSSLPDLAALTGVNVAFGQHRDWYDGVERGGRCPDR